MSMYASDKPSVSKQIDRDIAYYRVIWSALFPSSRERIRNTVPSLPGLWELYWLEKSINPRMLKMGSAWYGGLRNELRVEADEGEYRNRGIREYLNSGDCYYRYTICEIGADLEELYEVIASIRRMPGPKTPPARRYADVRISEPDEMIIHRVRRSHEKPIPRESFGNHVPNMFDVLRELRRREKQSQEEGREERGEK